MVNAKSKQLEVFYVSLDRNEGNFTAFRRQMPWPAIQFQDRKRAELEQALGVRALPCLIIFDKDTGEMVSREGRSAVMEDPQAVKFPWHESTVTELAPSVVTKSSNTVSDEEEDDEDSVKPANPSSQVSAPSSQSQAPPKGLVDGVALVVFTDKTSNVKAKTTAKQQLNLVASKYVKHVSIQSNSLFAPTDSLESSQSKLMSYIGKFKISFFLANAKSPILDAVRVLIGDSGNIDDESDGASGGHALFADLKSSKSKKSTPPSAVILDIPNRRYFNLDLDSQIDESVLEQFIFDVFSGKLTARPLAVDLDSQKK